MLSRLKEIAAYRDMIASLVRRDLRGRYKGSFLGFLWNFLNPMCQIAVYIVVFSMVFRPGLENFPVYLIVGMMPWNFFNESVCGGSGCVFAQGDMVKKIYFPREVLPLSLVASRFVNFLINYAIVFAIIIISGHGVNPGVLWALPFVMITEFTLALAAALLLSALDVYFRDVEYMCGVVMMALIWLTPIMYSIESVPPKLLTILRLNPMTPIICAYQNVLYFKNLPNMASLCKVFAFSVVCLILAELAFIKLEKRFAEEM